MPMFAQLRNSVTNGCVMLQISDIRKEPLGGTGLNDDTHTQ